jgi:DNA invertase Pin-like site-specific DNA recombinase
LHNATLVIAKLDRLSRDAAFLLGLQKAGVRFVAADMPEADELVVGMMAVVVQAERKMISARTKAALTVAKARGLRLGKPENLRNQDKGRVSGRVRRTEIAGERAADLRPIIPTPDDQNPWAQSRSPSDMMRQGWSVSLFQAAQQ